MWTLFLSAHKAPSPNLPDVLLSLKVLRKTSCPLSKHEAHKGGKTGGLIPFPHPQDISLLIFLHRLFLFLFLYSFISMPAFNRNKSESWSLLPFPKLWNEEERKKKFFSFFLSSQCKPARLVCKMITSLDTPATDIPGARWVSFPLFQSTQVNIQHSVKLHPRAGGEALRCFLVNYLPLSVCSRFQGQKRWTIRIQLLKGFSGASRGEAAAGGLLCNFCYMSLFNFKVFSRHWLIKMGIDLCAWVSHSAVIRINALSWKTFLLLLW